MEISTENSWIVINREINSGYWDYPIREVTRDAVLLFIDFFDWDALSYRDNQYARVYIKDWPSHKEAIGKQALLDSYSIRYVAGNSSS